MIENHISELRQKLTEALVRNSSTAGLISGGMDSGTLAYLTPSVKGFTVTLGNEGKDLKYISLLRDFVGLDVTVIKVGVDEAVSCLREVVKILGSFDPALPNDLAVYFGMREAKRQGFDSIMTGDGGDELLGGYPYMRDIDDLDGYIRKLSSKMSFSSNEIGEHFSLEVKQPYLDPAFIEFALSLPAELKIREENGETWGKWALRKAFESFLPPEFIWQNKRPLEVGSGMSFLRKVIAERITDEEFEEKTRTYPVKFICREHIYFYEVYLQEVGEIPQPGEGENSCPGCGGGIPYGKRHCKICGAVI